MSVLKQSNKANSSEFIFTPKDDAMWSKLYKKQSTQLQNIATKTFLKKLEQFNLPTNRVPTLNEISERLLSATGWQVRPVKGLIGYNTYFSLLKRRQFPVAMFMRTENEENLSKDPDLFHEVFGHCTMLMFQPYADFMQSFAEFALSVLPDDQPLFSRLIWFTTETGLIRSEGEIKVFGSSVLSSYDEARYAVYHASPIRKPFDIVNIFREPYRADILQKVYYILDHPNQLYSLLNDTSALYEALEIARSLGEFEPLFEVSNDKYSNVGHCYPIGTVCV